MKALSFKRQKTHAGDRVPELDDLGVSSFVDPDIIKEVREIFFKPRRAVRHEWR